MLLGVASNRAFLARVLRHPAFADGAAVSTAFIERHFPEDADRATVPDDVAWSLAAWLSVAAAPESGSRGATPWRQWTNGLPLPAPWRLRVAVAAEREGKFPRRRTRHASSRSGTATKSAARAGRPASDGQVEIDGASIAYRYAWSGSTLWLHTRRRRLRLRLPAPRAPPLAPRSARRSAHEVRAAINGRVLESASRPART